MTLTQEIVRELLDYDPETGLLHWKERDVKWFDGNKRICNSWNARFANQKAFSTKSGSYFLGSLLGIDYKAHRLIWLWMTGEWPKVIDHIDGNGKNNSWLNLRSVTQRTNTKNCSLSKNNKSGHSGVSWLKSNSKWEAYIWNNYKKIGLGYFENKDDAIKARKDAEEKYGFHPNHGRRQSLELT